MRTWLRRSALSVLAAGTFTGSLVFGAVYHLDLPLARRAAAETIRLALGGLPAKTSAITIGSITRTPTELLVSDVGGSFTDAEGRPALTVRGLSARMSYVDVAEQWLASGSVTLAVHDVHIRSADVSLEGDGGTLPRVGRAFYDPARPKKPGAPAGTAATGAPAFTLVLDEIAIDHAWVHGVLAKTVFDGDADQLHASLTLAHDLEIHLEDADLTARAFPRPTHGRVRGRVWVGIASPAPTPVELAADFDGTFGDAQVHARATGDIVRLDGVGFARAEGGTADATASLWLPTETLPTHALVRLRTRDVPLREISPAAPDGTASVDALAAVVFGEELSGTARVVSQPTTIAGQRVPKVVAKASGQGKVWRVDGEATDVGLDVLAGIDVDGTHLRGDVTASVRDLGHIALLPPLPLRGQATAHVTGGGDLATMSFDAAVTASATGFGAGPSRADRARVDGKVVWRDGSGTADATAVLEQGAARLDLAARGVRFGAGGLVSGDATARAGAGHAELRLRALPGGLAAKGAVVTLRASDVAPFLRIALPIDDAVLSATIDGRLVSGLPHGSIHARADGIHATLSGRAFADATVVLDAEVDGHDASLVSSARLDDGAEATVSSSHVHVPRLAFDRASLLAITGRTELDANATFACLRVWFGDAVPSAAGNAQLRLVYEHEGAGPHLAYFEAKSVGAQARVPVLGELPGVDALASGVISLDDGHADLGVDVHDRLGSIVTARVGVAFDSPVWDTVALTSLDRWKRTPATIHLEIADRDIAALPSAIRPTDLEGRIGAVLDVAGTALAPRASFSINEHDGRVKSRKDDPLLDLHVEGTYDGQILAATVDTRGLRATTLDGEAKLTVPWAAILDGTAKDVWEASARLHAEKLALGALVGWFTKVPIHGAVTGVVAVEGLHRDATAGVNLLFDGVAVGKRQLGTGHVIVLAEGGHVAANVDLAQKFGRFDAAFGGDARWGASLVPTLNLVLGVDGYVRASSFDVSFLRPFVRNVLPSFSAVIDSELALHLTSELKKSHGEGTITLSGGRSEIAALGDELRDVRVRVDLAKDGRAKISQVEIYPATGRINADGDAVFEGLDFRSARLHLRIPSNAEIPLGLEGMPVGDLNGDIDVTIDRKDGGLAFGVTVPTMRLVLAPALGRTVQDLEPDPHIHLGRRAKDGGFEAAPLAAATTTDAGRLPIHVDLTLGDDVRIKRQSDLDARVVGKLAIDLRDALRIGGAVRVPEGYVEIQGRRFKIERARVSFDGQPPSDPIIQATARYDATGGIKIYADYVGALSTGRVSLRSEPAMPPNEIVATLVFGSPTAQLGTASAAAPGTAALQAAAFAGGYVAQGLNRALDDISPLAIATRIDTTSAQNPRPELSVRVAKDVSVTFGVNLGTPSPGQPPDRTILQIEYQFLPQWRVRTTTGDSGSSILDFLWQYRY